jgi:hypothetical protein
MAPENCFHFQAQKLRIFWRELQKGILFKEAEAARYHGYLEQYVSVIYQLTMSSPPS